MKDLIWKLYVECLRLESWDIDVVWVREGKWFKIRNGKNGRVCYDSVMFDFLVRGNGEVVGSGNYGFNGEYEFDMIRKGVIEEMSLKGFVDRLFWDFN